MVGRSCPGVDLLHLCAVEQSATCKEPACCLGLRGSIVATVGTGIIFDSTVSDTCVGTLRTVISTTEVLTFGALRSTFAQTFVKATIGTGCQLNPGITTTPLTVIIHTSVGASGTDITTNNSCAGAGIGFGTAFGATCGYRTPGSISEPFL